MKEVLRNPVCSVEFDADKKELFGRDLRDRYNEPAIYNKTRRGIKKAWQAIKNNWTEDTTLHDIITTLQEHKIRTHYWCMVD